MGKQNKVLGYFCEILYISMLICYKQEALYQVSSDFPMVLLNKIEVCSRFLYCRETRLF